jgi:hypothetical protein
VVTPTRLRADWSLRLLDYGGRETEAFRALRLLRAHYPLPHGASGSFGRVRLVKLFGSQDGIHALTSLGTSLRADRSR